MNYQKIYDSIIEKAKGRSLECYTERHHIIPQSMGGNNDVSNLVDLTAREHFICHWLLYKIHKNDQMAFAWNMMSLTESRYHGDRKRQTSKKYEFAKKAFSKHISKVNKGRKLSEEHRKKLSESKIGQLNPMYGKSHSKLHKEYLAQINSGEKNAFYGKTHTNEARLKISESAKQRTGEKANAYGMKHSEETKERLSEMNRGKPRAKPHETVKCPHCDKHGIKPNMIRWHFDNCKEK